MKENRENCVLYATATCNLACKYCYIDKSPILKDIDKLLEDSFQGDYYFNFMKKMFFQDKLTRIEIWGGEPSYGLKRTLPTILKAIDYFPNLSNFFFSTNLTTNSCIDDIFNFYKSIAEKDLNRNFTFTIQLSIDGPTKINDFNRGVGTTDKFTKNFCQFILKGKDFLNQYNNIQIEAFFKPTLDGTNILSLNTKEKISNYFHFLDQYKIIFDQYSGYNKNFSFSPSIPNTATPSPHTQQEGKAFALMCKNIRELYEENPKRFYYYSDIMPFYRPKIDSQAIFLNGYSGCGTGDSVLGLLPNDLISGCHNGFTDLLQDIKTKSTKESNLDSRFFNSKDYGSRSLVFTESEYETYEKQMQVFYDKNRKFPIVEMASLIRTLALSGQVDEQYKDYKNAVEAAHFIQERTCSCIRDNINITGSKYLTSMGFIRLFLNGAKEEMEAYDDLLGRK